MSDRPLSEQVRTARKADVDLGLLGDEIATLEAKIEAFKAAFELCYCSAGYDRVTGKMCRVCGGYGRVIDVDKANAALEGREGTVSEPKQTLPERIEALVWSLENRMATHDDVLALDAIKLEVETLERAIREYGAAHKRGRARLVDDVEYVRAWNALMDCVDALEGREP